MQRPMAYRRLPLRQVFRWAVRETRPWPARWRLVSRHQNVFPKDRCQGCAGGLVCRDGPVRVRRQSPLGRMWLEWSASYGRMDVACVDGKCAKVLWVVKHSGAHNCGFFNRFGEGHSLPARGTAGTVCEVDRGRPATKRPRGLFFSGIFGVQPRILRPTRRSHPYQLIIPVLFKEALHVCSSASSAVAF